MKTLFPIVVQKERSGVFCCWCLKNIPIKRRIKIVKRCFLSNLNRCLFHLSYVNPNKTLNTISRLKVWTKGYCFWRFSSNDINSLHMHNMSISLSFSLRPLHRLSKWILDLASLNGCQLSFSTFVFQIVLYPKYLSELKT